MDSASVSLSLKTRFGAGGGMPRVSLSSRTGLFVLGLVLVFLTSTPVHAGGCMTKSPPKPVDAFTGVLDRQSLAAGTEASIASPGELNVAVILSENTKKQVAWLTQVMQGIGGFNGAMNSFFMGSTQVEESNRACRISHDPKFITDSVMQPLVHRFRNLSIVGSVAEFTQGEFDLLALIDVSFSEIVDSGFFFGAKYETGTTINVYFIDRANVLVGRVEVSQKRKANPRQFLQDVAAQRADTLAEYQTAIDSLLGPDPTLVSADPATGRLSVTDRLRTLEDLVRQGLITPEEAARKKANILESF